MIVAKRANDWLDLLHLPDLSWWHFLIALLCLVVLVWSIVRLVSRVNEDVDPAESDQEMLSAISELRREGDLTEDEYRSIKSQLMGRMNTTTLSKPQQPKGRVDRKDLPTSTIGSEDSIIKDVHNRDLNSEQSESDQSTPSVSLTELPDSLSDTDNNAPGLIPYQAENGEESD